MAEIVYLITTDADLELARARHLHDRIYFIDIGTSSKDASAPIKKLATAVPPRIITSHQVRSIFKKPLEETKAKFVIVIRNIKDALVFYYHFCRAHIAYGKYKGSFDDFYELFKHDQLNQGNWCDWLLDWWQEKDNPNVLFVMYENMIKDLPTEVGRVAAFLGKTLSDDAKANLCEYVSFNSMRENPNNNLFGQPDVMDYEISHFMRKGQVGDWKNYFSKEQSDYVDRMYEERVKSAGITVQFEWTILNKLNPEKLNDSKYHNKRYSDV